LTALAKMAIRYHSNFTTAERGGTDDFLNIFAEKNGEKIGVFDSEQS
jgi:hypothetical protein